MTLSEHWEWTHGTVDIDMRASSIRERTIKHHHTHSVCATYIMEPICPLWTCRWGLITKLPTTLAPSLFHLQVPWQRGVVHTKNTEPTVNTYHCVLYNDFFLRLDNRARDTAFSAAWFALLRTQRAVFLIMLFLCGTILFFFRPPQSTAYGSVQEKVSSFSKKQN